MARRIAPGRYAPNPGLNIRKLNSARQRAFEANMRYDSCCASIEDDILAYVTYLDRPIDTQRLERKFEKLNAFGNDFPITREWIKKIKQSLQELERKRGISII